MVDRNPRNLIPAVCSLACLGLTSYLLAILVGEGISQVHASGGTAARAIITRLSRPSTIDTTGGGVSFHWSDSEGHPHDAEQDVSWTFSEASAVGKPVNIRYSSASSGSSTVEAVIVGEELWRQGPYVIQGVVGLGCFVAILAFLIWMTLRGFRINQSLSSVSQYFVFQRSRPWERGSMPPMI